MKTVSCCPQALEELVQKGFIAGFHDLCPDKVFVQLGPEGRTWRLYQPLDLGGDTWVLVPPQSQVLWVDAHTVGTIPWARYAQGGWKPLLQKAPYALGLLLATLLAPSPGHKSPIVLKPQLPQLVLEQWQALAPPPPPPPPVVDVVPAPAPPPAPIRPRPAPPVTTDALTQAAQKMLGGQP